LSEAQFLPCCKETPKTERFAQKKCGAAKFLGPPFAPAQLAWAERSLPTRTAQKKFRTAGGGTSCCRRPQPGSQPLTQARTNQDVVPGSAEELWVTPSHPVKPKRSPVCAARLSDSRACPGARSSAGSGAAAGAPGR